MIRICIAGNATQRTFNFLVVLGFVAAMMMPNLAYAWPWDAKGQPAQKSQEQSPSNSNQQAPVKTRVSPEDNAAQSGSAMEAVTSAGRTEDVQSIVSAPFSSPIISRPKVVPIFRSPAAVMAIPKFPRVGVAGPVAGIPKIDTGLTKVQQQIQEIIRLNDTLKIRHVSQASELQRITDLARSHKRILDAIATVKKVKEEQEKKKKEAQMKAEGEAKKFGKVPQQTLRDAQIPTSAAVSTDQVAKEKFRLIQEETARNREFLRELSEGGTPTPLSATTGPTNSGEKKS